MICQAASVTQPDRLTWLCDHLGVTTIEDLTPRVFPLLVRAPSSCHIWDSNSCPPDLELGALTKWLASRMLFWVSAGCYSCSSIFWIIFSKKCLFAYMENTLNGEKNLKLCIMSVTNIRTWKNFLIFYFSPRWIWRSQKNISRYCLFKCWLHNYSLIFAFCASSV